MVFNCKSKCVLTVDDLNVGQSQKQDYGRSDNGQCPATILYYDVHNADERSSSSGASRSVFGGHPYALGSKGGGAAKIIIIIKKCFSS